MKRRILRAGVALLILLSLLITPAAQAVGSTVYTNTRQLADNLQLVNTINWSSSPGRVESFALRLTGPGDAYPIVMTGSAIFGANRISTIVAAAESMGKNVLAAINADFFSMRTGVPIGIVIEDGLYRSSPNGRTAVGFDNNGSVFFVENAQVSITLTNNGGSPDADNAGQTTLLYHFNKYRVDTGGMYLFSEDFSSVSTRTTSHGWFVRFRILYGTPSVSGTMTLEVVDTLEDYGYIEIGEGYMVLTAATIGGFGDEFAKFAVGDNVTLTTTASDPRLATARYATGGGDILIANGAMTDPSGWDQALLARAPRTAFGVRADGTVISIVVDGRDAAHSVGLTLTELADELLRQGAVHAINFDGGGSSAISARLPGERVSSLISRPSEGTERACATYILFVTNAQSDGFARNLSLASDGTVILAGSVADLIFTATDRGYMPVAAPGDITATPTASDSSVIGAVYTAGEVAGVDTIHLYSPSTGARGFGEMFVITEPTSIIVTRAQTGTRMTSITLAPNEVLEFNVTATYYRRPVIAQTDSFTYEVSGDIGEMTEPGVFRAADAPMRNGTITVSAGERQEVIQVRIGGGFTDMVGHWASDYVEYLFNAGIVNGLTPTTYGPEREIRRGDFMLMLYRAAGEPEVTEAAGFDDVSPDVYYAEAVAWAQQMGIAQGVGNNRFNPSAPLTRQQAFTFVYRALDILDIEHIDGTSEDLTEFSDAASVADFAVIPTATLIRLGVVSGSNGRLLPESSLTRAQMARVLAAVLWL